jgi:hypothetical protein
MDNVTLFKKILSGIENDPGFSDSFAQYFDYGATHPKLGCNAENLTKFSFSNPRAVQSLLCSCNDIQPEIAKSAYDCVKPFENDDDALLHCKSEVKAVKNTVTILVEKTTQDSKQFSHIMRTCNPHKNASWSLENLANFHACFMPEACGTYLSRVLACVNNNNQELRGCEKDIAEMTKCSIDKFHQHLMKTVNMKNDEELVLEAMDDLINKKLKEQENNLQQIE